jgi:integrase
MSTSRTPAGRKAEAKAAWLAEKAKRPQRKGLGTVEWSENAAGFVTLRGRLVHGKRTVRGDDRLVQRPNVYLTDGVGLGKVPTRKAVLDADAEVRDRLAVLADRLRRGYKPDPARDRRTVGQQVERWLKATERTAPEGHAHYADVARLHILPYRIAGVALRALTEDDLDDWLADLAAAGASTATARYAFDRLMEALRLYLAGGEVPNVRTLVNAAGQHRPKHRKTKPAPLDEAQTESFLAHLRSGQAAEPYATLLALQLLTGLRWGEAAGVRRGDVHGLESDDRATISIAQRIDKETRAPMPTKSEAGERELPLGSEAVELLRAYLARLEAEGRAPGATELLFSVRGKPVAYRTTLNWLVKFTEAAGLGRLSKTHRLRHTFGTLGGGDTHTPVLGGLLGHADARTTLGYTGRRMQDMRDAAERIGRRMTGNGRPGAANITPIVTPTAETPGG